MLLTNHTLTGLVLSREINNPLLLAPAALASHFLLDSLPHFGPPNWSYKSRPWLRMAVIDNFVALGLFAAALAHSPERWRQILIGVFFATLPDLLFLLDICFGHPVKNWFTRLHSHVQWSHSNPGILVELSWAVLMISLLAFGR